MIELFANSGDPDQTPQNAASDLGLHCLPITSLGVSRQQWVNKPHLMRHTKLLQTAFGKFILLFFLPFTR